MPAASIESLIASVDDACRPAAYRRQTFRFRWVATSGVRHEDRVEAAHYEAAYHLWERKVGWHNLRELLAVYDEAGERVA